MAIHIPTTAAFSTEDWINFTHSPISRAFSQLLAALAGYIEAERDLEDVDNSLDPAYTAWLRDAEEAQTRVTTLLYRINHMMLQRPEDRPLQRLCLMVNELLGSEDREEFARLRDMILWCSELFVCPGDNAVARQVSRMLDVGMLRIDDIARLPQYAQLDPPTPD